MIFNRTNGILVEDIDIERRHVPTQRSGVDRVWPDFGPQVDLLGGDVAQLLPTLQPFPCIVLTVDRRLLAVERNGRISGVAQLMPNSLSVGHGQFS